MPDVLLIWARGFHFGSGMILVGVVAFRWLVLLPAFAGEQDETWQKFARLFRALESLFLASGAVLVASGIALFWAVAAGMSGTSLMEALSPDTLGTVFFQTQFGRVCQWRLGFLLIFGLMLGKLRWERWLSRRRVTPVEIAAGLLAAALVVSLAWTGHAAAAGRSAFWLRIFADATHLLAASIWPTGLLPFALFLNRARQADDLPRLRPVLIAAHRFSQVSLVTVTALALTGIINAYFIVGGLPVMVATEYGRLLCLKIFVFLVMLALAAWNRYRLLPLLFTAAAAAETKPAFAVVRRLHRFVLADFGLAVAIVAIVSVLGTTPPP